MEREARRFGLVAGVVLTCLPLAPRFRHGQWRIIIGIAALAFLITAMLWPRVLIPVRRGWMALGRIASKVISPVVLAVLYYGVITPFGFLLRGRNPLRLRFDRQASTYWIERRPPGPPADSMARQF